MARDAHMKGVIFATVPALYVQRDAWALAAKFSAGSGRGERPPHSTGARSR